jgi:transposase
MVEKIIKEVINSDIKNTALNNEVSEQEIQTMLKDKGEELKKGKPVGLKKLGIDEIALEKGKQNYCAVLVNIETGELLGILEKRNKEELIKYMKEWGEEVLLGIEEVSIDMWRPYQKVAEEMMPEAEVVVDRFHVMKQINEELDKARRSAKREMELRIKKAKNKKKKQELKSQLEILKNSKYVLLKNREDLEEEEVKKMDDILKNYEELGSTYRLKEKLRQIFNTCENWADGLLRITNWMRKAIYYLPKSCGVIKKMVRGDSGLF